MTKPASTIQCPLRNTSNWITPIYCINESKNGTWTILQQSSAIPHGTFKKLEDATKHIEEQMNVPKDKYQINPFPEFPNTFTEFIKMVQAQERP